MMMKILVVCVGILIAIWMRAPDVRDPEEEEGVVPAGNGLFYDAIQDENGWPMVTRDDLSYFDGSDESLPLLIAISGRVFDVSSEGRFYGPDGPYNCFAGKAATRALVLATLVGEDINDDIDDFTEAQMEELEFRTNFYADKYPQVAVVTPKPF
jgi:membrane-associated progesterone receptor component